MFLFIIIHEQQQLKKVVGAYDDVQQVERLNQGCVVPYVSIV